MDAVGNSIVSILMAIIGVAVIAVLISPKANTSSVLSAGGSAFSSVLGTALSPVTGGSTIGNIANGISNIAGIGTGR